MSEKQAEYVSLREELISHQGRRESVLSIGLTLTIALIAAGLELKNPYVLLSALLILLGIRVQITHIHSGIQRIAAYLRVVHEENNPDLNWETTSYQVRRATLKNQSPRFWKFEFLVAPAFSPMEYLLGLTGIVSIVAALFVAQTAQSKSTQTTYLVLILSAIGVIFWFGYGYRTRHLRSMKIEESEAQLFRDIVFPETKLVEQHTVNNILQEGNES